MNAGPAAQPGPAADAGRGRQGDSAWSIYRRLLRYARHGLAVHLLRPRQVVVGGQVRVPIRRGDDAQRGQQARAQAQAAELRLHIQVFHKNAAPGAPEVEMEPIVTLRPRGGMPLVVRRRAMEA